MALCVESPGFAVEIHNFSTFSTDFSTGVFHNPRLLYYSHSVYIITNCGMWEEHYIFPYWDFHQGVETARKKVLDSPFLTFLKKTKKFLI